MLIYSSQLLNTSRLNIKLYDVNYMNSHVLIT